MSDLSDKTVLSFGEKLKADVSYLWANNRIFLIGFGVLIILAKGASLLMDFLAWRSKQLVDSTVKQDDVLKKQEDAAKSQADALVKRANELPSQEKPVSEDWNKKK